jgi:hypothetical protein
MGRGYGIGTRFGVTLDSDGGHDKVNLYIHNRVGMIYKAFLNIPGSGVFELFFLKTA